MISTSFFELLNRSVMLSIGERRTIFLEEKRKALSGMLSRGIGPGSGCIAGMIGELCIKELPIRTNIILKTIERVVLDSGVKPFHGLAEMLKKEALKFIPAFLGEFRSIIDNLHIKMIKSDYFEHEFLAARLNAQNKINNEIDLLILRIHSSLKDKMASVGSQTIYNIQSQGGIVQTGNGSKATLVSINLSNKNEIIRSLDFVLESIREAKDIDAGKKEETKEMIDELRLEIAKQKPNGIKLSSLLFGLAATIQTIASIQPAYNALKAAILPLGIHLP